MCGAGDCRDERKDHKKLTEALSGVARVVHARCQKICDGPIAGVEVDGRLEWFARIDDKSLRSDFIDVVKGREVSKRLQKRRSPDRSGKLRD